jgi:hypothetical protein
MHSTTAIIANMVFLYVWKKYFLLDLELLEYGEFEPSRVATKSAWACAGSVVDSI